MDDLKLKLKQMKDSYQHIVDTKIEIFEHMENTLFPIAYEMLDISKDMTEWKNVFLTNDILTFIGTIPADLGEFMVDEDGKELVITEENVDLYKRVLRIGIPVDLVVRNNEAEIIDFFKNNSDTNGFYDDVDEIENDLSNTVGNAPEDILDSFDMTSLTPDQIQNLILNNPDKGKLN